MKYAIKFSLFIFLFAVTQVVFAQTERVRNRSLYVEILGPSNGIGFNYEARFKKDSPWTYRAGLAFGYSQSSYFFGSNQSTRVYSMPIGINYLVGKRHHQLEIGAGVNTGIYNDHTSFYVMIPSGSGFSIKEIHEKSTKLDAFSFLTVGYRYTSSNGFQFRAGVISAVILTNRRHVSHNTAFAPYISFGKAF